MHRLLELWALFLPLLASAPAQPVTPVLINPGFECAVGYYDQADIRGMVPVGWTALILDQSDPLLCSTQMWMNGGAGCFPDENNSWEKIEGTDSVTFVSEDIESLPEPGKPFDAAVYQRTAAVPGVAYSLSAWMVSLCGGSADPASCATTGHTITKMIGIDPKGGTNPQSADIVWVSDARNFTETRWLNMRLGVTAQASSMTVFVRVNSPFQHHGNHAFADGVSLVRAPLARFTDWPGQVAGKQVELGWDGVMGEDIERIPDGTHRLYFDIQYRPEGDDQWHDWLRDQAAGRATFTADVCLPARTYAFRVRARAEQPPESDGAWPNHRYPGVWSAPQDVKFVFDAAGCE